MPTEKQEKFAREYVKSGNATQAAKNAGYSEATAKQAGHRALTNVDVATRIAELRAEAYEAADLTPELIAKSLMHEAVTAKEGGTRVRALELIGKTMAMFVDVKADDTRTQSTDTLISQIAKASPRAALELARDLGVFRGMTDTEAAQKARELGLRPVAEKGTGR